MFKIFGTITNYSKRRKIAVKKIDPNFFVLESPKIKTNISQNLTNINFFKEIFNTRTKNFIRTLQKENINLDIFFSNLNTLNIENANFFENLVIFNNDWSGKYHANTNTIKVLKRNNFISLYHELLHCASTKKVNNHYFSGFSQRTSNTSIGMALNEGYTSLLERRYFNHNKYSYPIEQIVAELVELIVGKEKMQSLYFNADLFNLIEELKKYSTEENIKQFLACIDEISIKSKDKTQIKKLYVQSEFVANFLTDCLLKSLNEKVNNGNLSNEEIENIYIKAIGKLSTNINIKDKNFCFIDINKQFELTLKYYKNKNQKKL